MRVLGVCIGHDSSACLVEDGRVVRYAAEERFNRLKVGVNSPIGAFNFALGDLRIEDLDTIAVSAGISGVIEEHFNVLLKNRSVPWLPVYMSGITHHADDISFVDHHLCHAASGYYTSGYSNALIVSLDGMGEATTHYVAIGEGRSIDPISVITDKDIVLRQADGAARARAFRNPQSFSLGWFYGMATEGLGWRIACDEGKTMGLAPYGDPDVIPDADIRALMYKRYPEGYYHDAGRVHYHFAGSYGFKALADRYGRENLAASAQRKLEQKVIPFINKWLKRTGQRNLVTAGGVFQNVKLNQRIAEECDVDSYWPFPLSSDTGVSIGAALAESHRRMAGEPYTPERVTNLYWGPEYSNQEIEALLVRNKLQYRAYDPDYVASQLAENRIVAWFRGRMEGGPRALGSRSILMSPLRAENKDIINAQVKFREGFRPFCPSVTSEAADRYFDGGGNFMIVACNVRGEAIPAVTHVDGTSRPQFVTRTDNPAFHDLLTRFGGLTGHPVLINTSLNVMGEPIIRTPDQAIRCFYGVGLDLLVIGDFMLEKAAR